MMLGAAVEYVQVSRKYGGEKGQERLAILCQTMALHMFEEGLAETGKLSVK